MPREELNPEQVFNLYSPAFALGLAVVAAFLLILNRLTDGAVWPEPVKKSPPRQPQPSVSPEQQRELLALVCPDIRAVLEAELRAGNCITGGGAGGDWPWPDSTIITLALIFQSEPTPLLSPLRFGCYNYKTAIGDTIDCPDHHILIIAAMPTLEQHLAPDVLVGHERKERLQQLL